MIIQPLWSVLNDFLDNEVEVCLSNSKENLDCWAKILEEFEKKPKNLEKDSWIEPIKEEVLRSEGDEEKLLGNDAENNDFCRKLGESETESQKSQEL